MKNHLNHELFFLDKEGKMSLSNPKAWAVCLSQMLRVQKGVSRRLSLIKITGSAIFSVR